LVRNSPGLRLGVSGDPSITFLDLAADAGPRPDLEQIGGDGGSALGFAEELADLDGPIDGDSEDE